MRSLILRQTVVPLAALAALALRPDAASAQDGFLFHSPVVTLTLRGGPMVFSAGGDLFNEMRSRLTLDRTDFRTAAFGADLVLTPLPRFDFAISLMYSEVKRDSEFRDWVDWDPVAQREIPIEQVTQLRSVPLTASVRYQVLSRGRRISDLAWLPTSFSPYIGAGAGVTFFSLQQDGEFVDETIDPPPIFYDNFETTGEQLTVHGLAGFDYWFVPRVGINAEARYTHASASPDQSYRSYNTLDLSGFQATLGLSIRW